LAPADEKEDSFEAGLTTPRSDSSAEHHPTKHRTLAARYGSGGVADADLLVAHIFAPAPNSIGVKVPQNQRGVRAVPTLYKPQLAEIAPSMLEIWDRLYEGLVPNARLILAAIGFYAKHDLPIPDPGSELSKEEKQELDPIVRSLMDAAVMSERMRGGVLTSTLDKVAKNPSLFFSSDLPAAVQWEIACDFQHAEEKPGTYRMDIWGDEQTRCSYALQTPNEANISKAAAAACSRIEDARTRGRPPNPANQVIAEGLSKVFRSSGQPIVRRRVPTKILRKKMVYTETGPFHAFLELVLPPLQRHLREHVLPPVNIDTAARLAIEMG
jgi:hypothetical protein